MGASGCVPYSAPACPAAVTWLLLPPSAATPQDKLGNFDTLPKKMPDLKGSHPTVYNYISSFISGDDVDAVELVAVELPGLGPGRMFLLPGAPEVGLHAEGRML